MAKQNVLFLLGGGSARPSSRFPTLRYTLGTGNFSTRYRTPSPCSRRPHADSKWCQVPVLPISPPPPPLPQGKMKHTTSTRHKFGEAIAHVPIICRARIAVPHGPPFLIRDQSSTTTTTAIFCSITPPPPHSFPSPQLLLASSAAWRDQLLSASYLVHLARKRSAASTTPRYHLLITTLLSRRGPHTTLLLYSEHQKVFFYPRRPWRSFDGSKKHLDLRSSAWHWAQSLFDRPGSGFSLPAVVVPNIALRVSHSLPVCYFVQRPQRADVRATMFPESCTRYHMHTYTRLHSLRIIGKSLVKNK